MAEIRNYPMFRHLRAEPSVHVLRFRRGKLVSSGRGASFWFRPLSTSLAEVPMDDRDIPFLFHGRARDFQDTTVQGVITFRVTDPEKVAKRIDFAIDLRSGLALEQPLEKLAGLLTELAQQYAFGYLAKTDLRHVLAEGAAEIREHISTGLEGEACLSEMGLEVTAVRVSSVKPVAEVEKALQIPVREAIQQEADEATFRRRAEAVQKERAIQENELQNQIELARREAGGAGADGHLSRFSDRLPLGFGGPGFCRQAAEDRAPELDPRHVEPSAQPVDASGGRPSGAGRAGRGGLRWPCPCPGQWWSPGRPPTRR